LLPLFNKGMRKFTRVFREVFEREIAKELDAQKSGVQAMMAGSSTKNIMKSLNDELNEGEVNLTKKMREEKAEFIKQFQKHQIKSTDEEFAKALEGKKAPSSISVAKRKRDSDDDVEELEKHVKKDKKDKKRFKKE
jgi:hypothetical protein